MSKEITMRRMGGSIGATLPKDIVDRMNIREGDRMVVLETADGVLLKPYDPHFERGMKIYERGAREYREVFRELAK